MTIDYKELDFFNQLPKDVSHKLISGEAFIPELLPDIDMDLYLELKDEGLLKEIFVRVGSNGTSKILLVAIETSKQFRIEKNFPNYKISKKLPSIFF